jgi:hypothetical protein
MPNGKTMLRKKVLLDSEGFTIMDIPEGAPMSKEMKKRFSYITDVQ